MFTEDYHNEVELHKFEQKYGQLEGYIGDSCPNCGRYRLERFSKGFTICEKCDWCIEENDYCIDKGY